MKLLGSVTYNKTKQQRALRALDSFSAASPLQSFRCWQRYVF
ncbi:hypothetical protein ACJJH9_13980 [Microbulbifer sp. DLAB2-AF]